MNRSIPVSSELEPPWAGMNLPPRPVPTPDRTPVADWRTLAMDDAYAGVTIGVTLWWHVGHLFNGPEETRKAFWEDFEDGLQDRIERAATSDVRRALGAVLMPYLLAERDKIGRLIEAQLCATAERMAAASR